MMQDGNELTDAGGRLIAEGLKGNCSVTAFYLVRCGVLFVCSVLLTCAGQRGFRGNKGMSGAVKREITQGLQEGHGSDKGVAIAASCRFYDFETCEEITVSRSRVRLLA